MIPELLDSSDLVKALPEMKNLANYGGTTLEANLQLAVARANIFRNKIREVKSLIGNNADVLGPNWQLETASARGVFGATVNTQDLALLITRPSVDEFKRSASYRPLGGSAEDFAYFLEFLRADRPNDGVAQTVDRLFASGVKFKPVIGASSPVGLVQIPYEIKRDSEGKPISAAPSVDTKEYKEALTTLSEFSLNNTSAMNFDPRSVILRISGTQANFEEAYSDISPNTRDLTRAQGVNFVTRADGSEIGVSEISSPLLRSSKSVILINHEFASSLEGEFGGDTSITETVLHEYGHSLHRSIDPLWGDERGGELDARYSDVRDQEVSSYGQNNDQEHFAEAYAKYLYTGEATDEYKKFLKDTLGIYKFDLNAAFPKYLRGNNFRDDFISYLQNNTDLKGYSIDWSSSSSVGSVPDSVLMDRAQRAVTRGEGLSRETVSLSGSLIAPNGSSAGTISRTLTRGSDGTLSVYHDLFKLKSSHQGKGLGQNVIEGSFAYYRSIGVDKVSVTAALDNGPYMWALMDFDFSSEEQRSKRHIYTQNTAAALKAYEGNQDAYSNMTPTEIAADIMPQISVVPTNSGVNYGPGSIRRLIESLRENGWVVDNNFINELTSIAELPVSDVTPKMIATIGRNNKRTQTKNSSSLGRFIMMTVGSWRGERRP